MSALYTHTTRGAGTILTSTIYNEDHQNHIDNGIPAMLDDYSVNLSQMRSAVDPFPTGSPSLPTSLAAELERIRFSLADIKGTTYWYEDNLGKGLDLIESRTLTALATHDFETGFSSAYAHMLFIFSGILPVTSDALLWGRFKLGGAYAAANYDYHMASVNGGAATYGAFNGLAQAQIVLSPAAHNTGSGAPVIGSLLLPDINGTWHKRCINNVSARTAAGVQNFMNGGGIYTGAATALQGLRLLFSTGNIAAFGSVQQYGIRA